MSFTIGSIKINGTEYMSSALMSQTQIVNDISNRTGTAQVVIQGAPALIASATSGSESGEVESGTFESGFGLRIGDLQPGSTLEIFGNDATRIFSGLIATVTPEAEVPSADGFGTTNYTVSAQDYCALLDGAVISTPVTYAGVTDASIIAALLTAYAPTISNSGVDTVSTVDSITFDNISVRQALENLIAVTGAQFWVDPYRILQYHLPAATPAPFAISETTDGVTTFQALKGKTPPTFSADFSNAANRVKVIGALANASTPYSATADNAGSQGYYGIRARTIVDRSLGSNAACLDRANVELATYGTPQMSGSFGTFLVGLAVGQALSVTWPSLNVSGTFLIRRVQMSWQSQTVILSSIQFGDYRPDLPKFLRKLAKDTAQPASAPVAIPAPFSVTPVSFAGTIQPVLLVFSNPALPNSNYPVGSIIENVTDLKLYKNITNASWDAVVNLADLPGQIGTTQITPGAVTTPLLAANSVTAINIVAAAITSAKLAANAVVAGTIAVGAINAADGVISNLAISTAQIANAAITAAKIASATITNAQIASATIQGANIAAATISDANIANLSASKITAGTAAIGGGKIVINGSGTIALEIFGGVTFHNDFSVDGSVIVSANLTVSGSTFLQAVSSHVLTCTGVSVSGGGGVGTSGNIDGGTFSVAGNTAYDGAGNNYANSYNIGGNRVVTNRQTSPGAPSFAVLADAQTWCAALLSKLNTSGHGLLT